MKDYPHGYSEEISLSLDMHDLLAQYRSLLLIQDHISEDPAIALDVKHVWTEHLEGVVNMCEYIFTTYPPPTPKWEVQHYTLADGWVNTWEDSEGPVTFETEARAQKALDSYLYGNTLDALRGDGVAFDPEEFRVKEIDEQDDQP